MSLRFAVAGGLCGLAAGVVSGVILQVLWALLPFALLFARPPAAGAGWLAHLTMSLLAGVVFGLIAGPLRLSQRGLLIAGILTGIILFLVGPVLLVPAVTGIRTESPLTLRWLKIGSAYLVFGAVLGIAYGRTTGKSLERRV